MIAHMSSFSSCLGTTNCESEVFRPFLEKLFEMRIDFARAFLEGDEPEVKEYVSRYSDAFDELYAVAFSG